MKSLQLAFVTLLASVPTLTFAAVDRYTIDPLHTYPSIEFSHKGMSVWRGKFNKTSGFITLDRAAKTGTVDVTVDVNSINFGLDAMDKKARSDDFFDAANHPTATYKGTVKFSGDVPTAIDGHVTIMGVTRPVPLTINLFKCMPHSVTKKEVCGADAEGELNYSEYGMKLSRKDDPELSRVKLRIQVEAAKD